MSEVNPFDGMNQAKVYETGEFFEVGKYDLEVKVCKLKKTYKSGICFLVEFIVIASDNPAVKVGAERTWMQKMDPDTIALPAIKGYLHALCKLGTKAEQDAFDSQAFAKAAIGEANPTKGLKVSVFVVPKTTKAGKDITVCNFRPYQEQAKAS